MENELKETYIEDEEKELTKKLEELKKKKRKLKKEQVSDKKLYLITGIVFALLLGLVITVACLNKTNGVDGLTKVKVNENSQIEFSLPSNYYLDDSGYFYSIGENHKLVYHGAYGYYYLANEDGNVMTFDEYLETITDYEVEKISDTVAYISIADEDNDWYSNIILIDDESNEGYMLQVQIVNANEDELNTIVGSLQYSE